MRMRLSPLGLAFGLSLAFVYSATARPVTVEDLAGRTICFSNGSKATFFRDGKYENNTIGKGAWTVTSAGVDVHAENQSAIFNLVIHPDGTFSDNLGLTGKYCK
jgi:hypothetical protein